MVLKKNKTAEPPYHHHSPRKLWAEPRSLFHFLHQGQLLPVGPASVLHTVALQRLLFNQGECGATNFYAVFCTEINNRTGTLLYMQKKFFFN